jgi:hypothetical protein
MSTIPRGKKKLKEKLKNKKPKKIKEKQNKSLINTWMLILNPTMRFQSPSFPLKVLPLLSFQI